MAKISGWDSSSLSTLFSSLNSSSKKTSTSFDLGIDYGEYNSIKNGTYYKLAKTYYSNSNSDSSTSTSTSADSAKTLASIQSTSSDLVETAKDLYKDNSLFEKKKVTDSNGNSTYNYDTDAIYEKVSAFVDDYNLAVSSANKTNTSSVATAAAAMVNYTTINASSLSKIGISIDSTTHKLSIDEDKFKASDMNVAKTLFNGTGSYAYSVASQASMVNYDAKSEAAKSSTYSSDGVYTFNYNTGSIYTSTT